MILGARHLAWTVLAAPLVESARESRNCRSLKIDPPDGVPLKVAHHECPDVEPIVS